MYLLTSQEQEEAMHNSNMYGDSITLRGDRDFQPTLTNIALNYSEVASTFCPTRRNIYLSRVLGIPGKTNYSMALGSIEHASVSITFNKVKTAQSGCENLCQVAEELESLAGSDEEILSLLWSNDNLESIEKYCVDFNYHYQQALPGFLDVVKRLLQKEAFRLRRSESSNNGIPNILAIEEFIDGHYFGMNRGKIDAVLRLPNDCIIICDMKRKGWNDNLDGKSQIAGYALAMEREYHVPINLGCLVFSTTLKDEDFEPKRDIFIIDDKLRKEFISRRDETMKVISQKKAPSMPKNAPWKCKSCGDKVQCDQLIDV